MGFDLHWHDEAHTVAMWAVGETFTWEEYHAVSARTQEGLAADGTCYTVIDACRLRNPPEGILRNLPGMAAEIPQNVRYTILVGVRQGMARIVADIAARVFSRVVIVDTLEAALAIIEADRAAAA